MTVFAPRIKLTQCNRCSAYVFACLVDGFKTAADPTPLTLDAYRQALIGGRAVYRLRTVAGAPDTLQRLTGANTVAWGAPGDGQSLPVDLRADPVTLVADHGCGTKAMNVTTVEVSDAGPHQAPVSPGRHRGGSPRPVAPASGQTPKPSPAPPATRRPSEPCAECGKPVRLDSENVLAIELGARVMWAIHAECQQ